MLALQSLRIHIESRKNRKMHKTNRVKPYISTPAKHSHPRQQQAPDIDKLLINERSCIQLPLTQACSCGKISVTCNTHAADASKKSDSTNQQNAHTRVHMHNLWRLSMVTSIYTSIYSRVHRCTKHLYSAVHYNLTKYTRAHAQAFL